MKKSVKWLSLYLAVLAALAVAIYIIPQIVGLFHRTYNADYGTLTVGYDEKAYVLRSETVYTAGRGGSITRLAKEGELIREGARVVQFDGTGKTFGGSYSSYLKSIKGITKSTSSGRTQQAGYVSYKIDKLEKDFAPDELPNLSYDRLKGYHVSKPKELNGKQCSQGEPVFKIVENGPWGIVFFTDSKQAKHFTVGNDVTVRFKDQKQSVEGTVVANEKAGGRHRVVIQSLDYFNGALDIRKADIKVITGRAHGILIKNQSIVKKHGKQGVIVKNKVGSYIFKPIMIKASSDTESAVYEDLYMDSNGNYVETVETYDEVVSRPDKDMIKEAKDLPNNVD